MLCLRHTPCARLAVMLLGLAIPIPGLSPTAAAAEPEKVDFNRQIRPILSDKCFLCHGPDSGTRKARLRLDLREEALKERRRGTHPIVPGKPEESTVVERIFAEDELDRMPPADSHLALTDAEKELIRTWVAQGAEYQPHWSLVPLPDQVPVPEVKNKDWPRSDLDRFVLARLEAEGLTPSPEAPRERWLRRVTYDLTGLPPTPQEVRDFLADTASDAYERVVDRLLASPRFGEKMAVSWLDVARYADSYGYQADLDTHAWPYRDWVIEAYNRNLPYDQFITQQLAGDLLPNADRSTRLATAFLRIHRKTQEGGSIEAEFRQDGVNDRVNTFGTTFLGLTTECSRCHDHKYDPFTMRDYYSLSAFFNSIDEWGLLHGNARILPHPVLYLPTPEQEKTLAEQKAAIEAAERRLAETRVAREAAFDAWVAAAGAAPLIPIDLAGAFDLESSTGNKVRNAADPAQPGSTPPANQFVIGRTGNALRFTGDDPLALPHAGARHASDPISVAFWLRPNEAHPRAVVFHNTTGSDPGYNGYELIVDEGHLRWTVMHEWPGNCISVRTRSKPPVGSWTHVTVTYDGSSRASGLRVYLDGKPAEVEVLRDKLAKDSGDGGRIAFGERFRDSGLRGGTVDEIFIFSRAITPIEVAQLHDGESLARALTATSRTPEQLAALKEYYLSAIDHETRAAAAALRTARGAYLTTMDGVREIPVMEELPTPRPTFILTRGEYNAPADPVERATPSALPPMPPDAPRNRLGLAQWLTQRNHPLTGRVIVNRIWQEFFSRGIVTTSDNFGLQGAWPSHPELLDWLARDFIDHGWDFKRFCRQIVLSATYRQDSRASRELRERDPDNALLARGPARRLSAEELRDSALALGGLLKGTIGGPSVKPYQPDGSMWKDLNNFLPEYKRDTGDGLYRRSLYTWWRRTTPPPNMLVFDAGTREVCVARRQLTLTPLQPLVLLNDPQFVEAARALGERTLREGGSTPESRAAWAFLLVTGREPRAEERNILVQLYAEQLALFREDASKAERLMQVGDYKCDEALPRDELAAATVMAGALINLDAAIMLR